MVRRDLLTSVVFAAALSAAAPALAAETPYVIERTVVTDVAAPAGRHYKVMVAWPEGQPPTTGWPVLYVLDGDDNFADVVSAARRLARGGPRSSVGPGVVVGVASEDVDHRILDYTPASPGYVIPAGKPASGRATGGADAFLDVLRDRIQPLVAQRWKIDARRQTILGHSFGGLLALHALAARPGQFQAYVAVSPSLWFGEGLVAREAASAKPPASVLIAAGDEPGAGELAEKLKATGLDARLLPLPGLSHGRTMFASLPEAVTFAFKKPAP